MSVYYAKHFRISSLVRFADIIQNCNRKTHSTPRHIDKYNKVNHRNASSASITHNRVLEFITSLNDEERQILIKAAKSFETESSKIELKGPTTALRWRSEFGRPSKITRITDADTVSIDSGTKCDDATIKPTRGQLFRLGLYNAVPFIGFGFLDNSIMILGGDSIEMTIGYIITISTMTAAALGNTLADMLGIGSVIYVERFASKLGVKQPPLTPQQLNMGCSRFAANLGRTLGVSLGCMLGMFPLLFIK